MVSARGLLRVESNFEILDFIPHHRFLAIAIAVGLFHATIAAERAYMKAPGLSPVGQRGPLGKPGLLKWFGIFLFLMKAKK